MKHSLLMLVACLCVATPCLSGPERFTTDRPSPLKLAKPAKDPGASVEFRGQAVSAAKIANMVAGVRQKTGGC